jgi:hypothetical protein
MIALRRSSIIHKIQTNFSGALKFSLAIMTLSKNSSQDSASAPSLNEVLRMQRRRQRQLLQDSRSSAPDNEESSNLLRPSTATSAPRSSHRTSRPMDTVLSILLRAIAVLEESDDDPEDSVISNRRDDSNSQP